MDFVSWLILKSELRRSPKFWPWGADIRADEIHAARVSCKVTEGNAESQGLASHRAFGEDCAKAFRAVFEAYFGSLDVGERQFIAWSLDLNRHWRGKDLATALQKVREKLESEGPGQLKALATLVASIRSTAPDRFEKFLATLA